MDRFTRQRALTSNWTYPGARWEHRNAEPRITLVAAIRVRQPRRQPARPASPVLAALVLIPVIWLGLFLIWSGIL
jgi:hypothetical protein